MVLVGPLILDSPFPSNHASKKPPLSVTFEKLLPVSVMVEPLTELPNDIKKQIWSLTPETGLLKVPTMWLSLQVKEEPEAILLELNIKNTLLPLFMLRLVKVLFKIFADSTGAFWSMKVSEQLPVTA